MARPGRAVAIEARPDEVELNREKLRRDDTDLARLEGVDPGNAMRAINMT